MSSKRIKTAAAIALCGLYSLGFSAMLAFGAMIAAVFPVHAQTSPTNVWVQVGGDSLDLDSLHWSYPANRSDITGFIISRHEDSTAWHEIARVSASDSIFADPHLVCHTTYSYNVLAYRTVNGTTTLSDSLIDPPVQRVDCLAWVRVIAPHAGETVVAGSTYHIQWAVNNVSMIRMDISLDGGRTWKTMLPPNVGITPYSPSWQNYAFAVPDTASTTAIVKVLKYEGTPFGLSGVFSISRNPGSVRLSSFANQQDCFSFSEVNHHLLIDIDVNKDFSLHLYSSSGRQVERMHGSGPSHRQCAQELLPGVYCLAGVVGQSIVNRRIRIGE